MVRTVRSEMKKEAERLWRIYRQIAVLPTSSYEFNEILHSDEHFALRDAMKCMEIVFDTVED